MSTKPQPKKPVMDEELVRIGGLVTALNELNERRWKSKRDLGEAGYQRAMAYISHRFGWLFNEINNPRS
jgi:hypothetical protein